MPTYSVEYQIKGLTKKRAYDLIIAFHGQFNKLLPKVKMYNRKSYKYAVKNDQTGEKSEAYNDKV